MHFFPSEHIDFWKFNRRDGHAPRASLSLRRYQPCLIFMVEYYEKINRLISLFIEPCQEGDTPLHPVGVAEAPR